MNSNFRLPLLAFPLLSLVGCAEKLEAVEVLDLAEWMGDDDVLQGVAKDPASDDLHVLLESRGLVQLTREGRLVKERPIGEAGLEERPYRDLAVIGDGRFLLIADNEGYLWDELAETEKVHFCVLPGGDFGDGEDGFEDVVQRNDALAITSSSILAAPRFYEGGSQVEASLRTYDVGSGEPSGSADLSDLGIDIAGLAVDGDTLVAVSGFAGSTLSRFSLDGELLASIEIDAREGVGLVVDGDEALVLDRDSERILSFDISDLN